MPVDEDARAHPRLLREEEASGTGGRGGGGQSEMAHAHGQQLDCTPYRRSMHTIMVSASTKTGVRRVWQRGGGGPGCS